MIYNSSVYALSSVQDKFLSQIYSGIQDLNVKTEFQYYPNTKHNFRFGINYINHTFLSGGKTDSVPVAAEIPIATSDNIPTKYFSEYAFYINDEYTINEKVSLNLGILTPGFFSGDATYFRVEPRATIKVDVGHSSSIKASYTIMNQFLHLVPTSTASLPTDLWIPTTENTKPQLSEQFALGYFKDFGNPSKTCAWKVILSIILSI